MIRAVDMGSTFALARYAAEKARPLADLIPGRELSVEVRLGADRYTAPWHISICVHRALSLSKLAPMPLQEIQLDTSAGVDAAIEKLRLIAENQSWELDETEKDHSEMDAA